MHTHTLSAIATFMLLTVATASPVPVKLVIRNVGTDLLPRVANDVMYERSQVDPDWKRGSASTGTATDPDWRRTDPDWKRSPSVDNAGDPDWKRSPLIEGTDNPDWRRTPGQKGSDNPDW